MTRKRTRGTRPPAKIPEIRDAIRLSLQTGQYHYTLHARERMEQRGIIDPEVEYVLRNGGREAAKDEFRSDHGRWNYAMRGGTLDEERELRVCVAFPGREMLIITAIDLSL